MFNKLIQVWAGVVCTIAVVFGISVVEREQRARECFYSSASQLASELACQLRKDVALTDRVAIQGAQSRAEANRVYHPLGVQRDRIAEQILFGSEGKPGILNQPGVPFPYNMISPAGEKK